MTLDVEALRAATPGTAHVTHLNNAGASLMPATVLHAVVEHLELEATIGGYEAADAAMPRLRETRASLARLLGAEPTEIAFTDNASRSWAMAASSIPLSPGDRVVTATSEYGTNGALLHRMCERHGVELVVVPDTPAGDVDVGALAAALDDRVKFVALTWIPGIDGVIEPAAEIGALVAQTPALFVLDATQAVGQLPVDVSAVGCDFLVGTSRKYLRGPRGVGFIYARATSTADLEPAMVEVSTAKRIGPDGYDLLDGAARFGSGECSVAARVGLGAALDVVHQLGIEAISERVLFLADQLRERLAAVPGVRLADRGTKRCGIVTFEVAGVPAADVVARLRADAINTSVSLPISSPFDPTAAVDGQVRASVHAYNTEAELDLLTDALSRVGG